jgi:16S rRNA (adenine1518-N6/adenine1519-N6)-dimethyltransferase
MSTDLPRLDAAALLREYGLRADKGLGQNFLQDPSAFEKILAAAGIEEGDTVLEIGPGLGSLTRYLAARARRVVAVEIDRRLFPALRSVLAPYANVHLIEGDILAFPPGQLVESPDYLVVANIPYYITSAVMRHLLEASTRPHRIVLTIQREVAERICAVPGDLGLLALSVQVYGRPRITGHIPAEAFYPSPKVDSAVLCMDSYAEPVIPYPLLDRFFRLAKAGFSQRRKTLRNALSAGLGIARPQAEDLLQIAGINPNRRAETLSLEEWRRLSDVYS